MIIDTLNHTSIYSNLSDRFQKAFKFIHENDFSKMEVGKYEIVDKEVFAMVSEYQSKNIEDAKWEAHKKYADIQLVITGVEKMGFASLNQMVVKEDYNHEKDVVFLSGTGDYVTVKPGSFVIFFPHDAHQPSVSINGSIAVKKVVIKVLV